VGRNFTDTTHQPPGAGDPARLPRGLVRPPQFIADRVAAEKARHAPYFNDEQAKRTLDDWTLAYYYEDLNVAYRSVPEGVEVLAVGDEEVGEFLRTATAEQLETVIFEQP
jgi:hypothetical protein